MNKIIMACFALVLAGCGAKSVNQQVNNSEATTKTTSVNVKAQDKQPITVLAPKFAMHLSVDKVVNECSMLETLEDSILNYGNEYGVNFIKQVDGSNQQSDIVLEVEYVSMTTHKFNLFALKPGSEAAVRIVVKKEDKVLDQVTKNIGSSVAFGACDRLEKIAVAGGIYIAKWAKKKGY